MGDFNARISSLSYFNVHIEGLGSDNPFENPKLNGVVKFPEFMYEQRISDNACVNQYGRKLLNVCKNTDVRILNGQLSDTSDTFTRIGTTGKSIVDYCIVDNLIANCIGDYEFANNFQIQTIVLFP